MQSSSVLEQQLAVADGLLSDDDEEEEEREVIEPSDIFAPDPPVAPIVAVMNEQQQRLAEFAPQLQLMNQMGYTNHHAQQALINHDFDADAALNFLMQHADDLQESGDEDDR